MSSIIVPISKFYFLIRVSFRASSQSLYVPLKHVGMSAPYADPQLPVPFTILAQDSLTHDSPHVIRRYRDRGFLYLHRFTGEPRGCLQRRHR